MNTSTKTLPQNLYKTPFSAAYWKEAVSELSVTRKIAIAGVLIAITVVVDLFQPHILGNYLKLSFSFLIAQFLCAICGPVIAVPAGFAVDLLSYLINSGGEAYFPGYALSSVLAYLLYALFFYRADYTFSRIFLCRLSVDLFIHVVVDCVWKAMLYGKGYLYYVHIGVIKNFILLPFEAAAMLVLLRVMLPVLKRLGLVPRMTEARFTLYDLVICVIAVAVSGVLIVYHYELNLWVAVIPASAAVLGVIVLYFIMREKKKKGE